MTDIKDFVCAGATSAGMASANTFVKPGNLSNPIGTFLGSRTDIIKAGNASLIARHPIIGRLLLIGSVSAFENYCRGVLAGCLSICPLSQARSSEKNVSLGGAIWHGPQGDFSRSAFEHKSLADVKELKSVFREYIGYDLDQNLYKDLLKSYEVVMQLRHAAVHADGFLPGKNAVKLEIDRSNPALVVNLGQNQVQECVLVLSALATTLNRELFSVMCHRWAIDWRQRADWKTDNEMRLLRNIFSLFVDEGYNELLPNRRKWGCGALKNALYQKYEL